MVLDMGKKYTYNGVKMSRRARAALRAGKFPLCMITRETLDEHQINLSVGVVRRLIRQGVIKSKEWHHYKDWAYQTPFYNLHDIRELSEALNDSQIRSASG